MKLSIIIPVHNMEKYIENLLQSIYSQTFKDYEIICVLDSCTDRSEDIIRCHPDIRVFHSTWKQPGMTRNIGLDNARGEWIWCLDADDWLLTDTAFEQVVNQLTNNIDALKIRYYLDPKRLTDYYSYCALWSYIIKRDSINKYHVRFPNQFYHEDAVFLAELRAINPYYEEKEWNNPEPLYFYNSPRVGSVRYNFSFYNRLFLAFTGTGKTDFCKEHPDWLDMDVVKYKQDLYTVVDAQGKWVISGKKVLSNVSLDVLKEFDKQGILINLIMPSPEMKDEIIERVRIRDGEDSYWYNFLKDNYDRLYNEVVTYPNINSITYLKPGQYVKDVIYNINGRKVDE